MTCVEDELFWSFYCHLFVVMNTKKYVHYYRVYPLQLSYQVF